MAARMNQAKRVIQMMMMTTKIRKMVINQEVNWHAVICHHSNLTLLNQRLFLQPEIPFYRDLFISFVVTRKTFIREGSF